jgi:hypothetical protein
VGFIFARFDKSLKNGPEEPLTSQAKLRHPITFPALFEEQQHSCKQLFFRAM